MPHQARAVDLAHRTRTGKQTRKLVFKGTALFLLFIFVTGLLHGNWVSALVWMSGAIGIWVVWQTWRHQRERTERLHELDTMPDADFIQYAAELLRAQGYEVQSEPVAFSSPSSLSPTLDLLLTRGTEQRLCRLQRQKRRIGEDTVIQTLSRMEAQGCQGAMVLANQAFTLRARTLARRENCILIDRDTCLTLMAQYQHGHRVLAFERPREATKKRVRRHK